MTSNIGQVGTKSIRIQGKTIDELPIAEAASAMVQLRKAEEDERKQLISAIKARYPTQDPAYLEARIREARGNIVKFREQRIRIGSSQEEYRMLLYDVKRRDKEIRKAEKNLSGDELAAKIKELNKEYGLWQRRGLERQLEQFAESIRRFEEHIEVEQKAIDELSELLGQCKARDKELARLGA
jgi:uncharacterized membrane protein YukC